jgi:hypothetical protein
MPTHAVYGRMTFNSARQRDNFLDTVVAAASARGFVAAPYEDYPAGAVANVAPSGSPALTICYIHADPDLVAQAETDLVANADSNGRTREGGDIFATGEVSDRLSPAEYLATLPG